MTFKILSIFCCGFLVPGATADYLEYKSGYVYKPEFEAEYKFHAEKKNWVESSNTCREENATLLLVDSKAESDFLKGLLQSFGTTSISIGGHDGFREGSFETLSGESLHSYWLQWGPSEPDGGREENCLYTTYYPNSTYDWNCYATTSFICKKIRLNERLQYCNAPYPGFVYNPKLDKCYKLQKNPRNWATAHAVCKSQEANLAFPNSKEEGDHFLNMVHEAFPNNTEDMKILIGMHRHYLKYWETVEVPVDKLDYKPWDSSIARSNNNGALTIKGQLTDVEDDYEGIYICEARNTSSTIATADRNLNDTVYNSETKTIYKIHKEKTTWFKARETCEAEDTSLIVIENLFEADFVKGLMKSHSIDLVFVNLHDMFKKGHFVTEKGVSIDAYYNEWGKNQPGTDNPQATSPEHCLAFTDTDKLHDFPCNDYVMAFICVIRLRECSSNPCNSRHLDYKYDEESEKCYKMHTKPLNWFAAAEICKSEDSHLAVVTNPVEAEHLMEMIKEIRLDTVKEKYTPNKVLLGFHRVFETAFESILGDRLQSLNYNEWEHNLTDEKCGAMSFDGKLSDISCDAESFFICEHDVKKRKPSLYD